MQTKSILEDLMRPFSEVCSATRNCELSTGILQVNDLKNDVLHTSSFQEDSTQPLPLTYHEGAIPQKWCHDNDDQSVEIKRENPDLVEKVDVQKENLSEEHADGVPFLLPSAGSVMDGSSFKVAKMEGNSEMQESHTQQFRLVRSWLAKRYSSCPRSSGEILDTLLRLAEDRIYLYGFDKRREREEFLEEQRASRRKRVRTGEETQDAKRRATGGDSTALSSFSFIPWNGVNPSNTTSHGQVLQPIDSSSILSTDEKLMFSRYALSSGRLRKECADPYQFLTTRMVELRHHIENEMSDGLKLKECNKLEAGLINCFMVLVDIIHPSASIECRREALRMVEFIFTNIVQHPSEKKYRAVKTSSRKWVEHVAPAFYLLQFFEWMVSKGFENDVENSFLYFRSNNLHDAFEALKEVRMLRRAYSTPVLKTVNDKDNVAHKLLPFLRTVAGLRNTSQTAIGDCTEERPTLILEDLWVKVKFDLRKVVLGDKHRIIGTFPQLPPGNAVVWKSLIELISDISLYELEEAMTLVDAERFDAVQSSGRDGVLEENFLQRVCARRRVAERHKANFVQEESSRDGAKIHKEVHLVASRLISDIASCMEQVATLEGDEGMVRKDRLEAWRLMKKFREDGDIEYLHILFDEWTERLQEVKKVYSKCLVYSSPF